MAVSPYYDFTIGDKSLDELGIRYLIKSIIFEEEIGKFCSIKMTLKSGPELGSAYYLLKHGAIFQLSMGYHNGLIQKMGLAFHVGIEPDWSQQTVTIKYADYLRAMSIGEKDRVLTGKTLKQVIQTVIADYAPLVMGVIDNGDIVISETISQSKRTDFALLQEIAKSFAMTWLLESTETPGIWSISLKKTNFDDDSSKYETMYAFPDKENQDITQNIHLKGFKPKSNILGDIPSRVTIESNNPNQPIDVDSKLYDEDRYISEARGSEIVYTVFGQVNRIQFYENVTDEEAAQIIADQMLQDEEIKFVQAKDIQLSEGNAGVRIGQRRHIVPKGLGLFDKVFEGDYLITRTKHQIDDKLGYNTWVNLGRESLTIPPPPEKSTGSGGRPVILKFDPVTNLFYGWYVSFPNGVLTTGAKLTDSEIRANDYWMDCVNEQMIWIPVYHGVTGFIVNDPLQQSVVGTSGYYEGMTIRVDFPDQWSTTPLAANVRNPSSQEPTEADMPEWVLAAAKWGTEKEAEALEQEKQAQYTTLGIGGYGGGF